MTWKKNAYGEPTALLASAYALFVTGIPHLAQANQSIAGRFFDKACTCVSMNSRSSSAIDSNAIR